MDNLLSALGLVLFLILIAWSLWDKDDDDFGGMA